MLLHTLTWSLVVVGFDTSDVGRLLGHQDVHQIIHTGLELGASLETNSNMVTTQQQHCDNTTATL